MDKLFYITSDINIAATLNTLGYDVEGINPNNPDRVAFYFDMDKYPTIEDVVKDYRNGSISVNPRDLFNNRRELLNRVHESKRQLGEE